jgi:hypothetical protein
MASFGERVIRCIIIEETKLVGCIFVDNLVARLTGYLDEADRVRLLADASAAAGEEITDLLDAFAELVPDDYAIEAVVQGFKMKPYPQRRARPS